MATTHRARRIQARKAAVRTIAAHMAAAGDSYAGSEVARAAVVAELRALGVEPHLARVLARLDADRPLPGPAGAGKRAEEAHEAGPAYRAAYLVRAAERVQRAVADPERTAADALATEQQQYLRRHLDAQLARERNAMRLDAARDAYGDTLGWYAQLDERTTAECRAADGKNFRPGNPPTVGLPGVGPHVGCRCYAGPPHEGAETMRGHGTSVHPVVQKVPAPAEVTASVSGSAVELAGLCGNPDCAMATGSHCTCSCHGANHGTMLPLEKRPTGITVPPGVKSEAHTRPKAQPVTVSDAADSALDREFEDRNPDDPADVADIRELGGWYDRTSGTVHVVDKRAALATLDNALNIVDDNLRGPYAPRGKALDEYGRADRKRWQAEERALKALRAKITKMDGAKMSSDTVHAVDLVLAARARAVELVSGDTSPFSSSHDSNWVAKAGGLPPRVRAIARAIKRKNPGWSLSRCIAVAINAVKYSAATGDSKGLPGRQNERASTVAAHGAAAARWAAMKASAHAHTAEGGVPVELGTTRVSSSGDGPRVTDNMAQRRKWAASGVALPDGSFPIPDRAHLRKAVLAHGRASDKAKAKRHIKKRARQLGATHMLPDGWG